ncbi:hypothetical protein PQX77_008403 [Marasmius sp. AFHP31]|nr:hypothetical protein PQX77_013016 [Marasmius sp. AFHP31]KAK1228538.1 hypothetical protein PQX77_008403 [Marasmius sp. AFHP31]
MAHHRKSKDKGVSASSFFELAAAVAEHPIRPKTAQNSTAVVGGVAKSKKSDTWLRANKGVKERHARDLEQEVVDRPTWDSARTRLEEKAKKYDKLNKGKTGGYTETQIENLLVDFESKPVNDRWESDSEDNDESLTVPKPPMDADDEIVEYIDDLGRSRFAPRSEVPRQYLKNPEDEEYDENIVIHNPVNHHPIFIPGDERVAEIKKATAESDKPLETHYDYSLENRARGAGSYNFSRNEQERLAELQKLSARRDETMRARAEAGAIDVKPGEVEGFDPKVGTTQSKAMEKRKRDLEERRAKLEANKRKKGKSTNGVSQARSEDQQPAVFMASANDPFAALEAASSAHAASSIDNKVKTKVVTEVDVFFAGLESDLLKGRGK